MLWDLKGAKITTLMPSNKMYMTMDLKEAAEGMKEAAKEMKKSRDEEEETTFPKLTETGKQETNSPISRKRIATSELAKLEPGASE